MMTGSLHYYLLPTQVTVKRGDSVPEGDPGLSREGRPSLGTRSVLSLRHRTEDEGRESLPQEVRNSGCKRYYEVIRRLSWGWRSLSLKSQEPDYVDTTLTPEGDTSGKTRKRKSGSDTSGVSHDPYQ